MATNPTGEKIELGYWQYRGLAHPIRFLLQHLGIPYEEKNYSYPEGYKPTNSWPEFRDKIRKDYPPQLSFPNLPYLIDGNMFVTESRAIMRYIARKYAPHLLGKTLEAQTKLEMLENYLYDFWYLDFAGAIHQNTKATMDNFHATHPVKLAYISKFIGEQKWCVGDDISYMDFWLFEFFNHLLAFDGNILKPYENLTRLVSNVRDLPAIKAYMGSPNFIERPYYSPRAAYAL